MFGRVAIGWSKPRAVVVVVRGVVPEPVLAGFEGPNDRMAGVAPMRGGVLTQRVVTAADVTACRAATQMHPPAAYGVALDAAGAAGRDSRVHGSVHD